MIQEDLFLNRIHNTDPQFVRLIKEYESNFEQPDGPDATMLWIVGIDIDSRIKSHQKRDEVDDVLNSDDISTINRFLLAHNLYLQCFPAIEVLIDDLDRSTKLYEQIVAGRQNLPWDVLEDLGKAENIVEEKSGKVMQKASSHLEAGVNNRGIVAIGFGLLRGCLQALGAQVLTATTKATVSAAGSLGAVAILAALRQENEYVTIVTFIETHTIQLFQLSEQLPHYFGWLTQLLHLIGFF